MNKEIKNNNVCSLCIWIFIAEQLQSNNGYGSGVGWLKGPNMSWFKITKERFFNTVPDHFFLNQISDFYHHCMPDGDESAYSELVTSLVSWCKTTFCLMQARLRQFCLANCLGGSRHESTGLYPQTVRLLCSLTHLHINTHSGTQDTSTNVTWLHFSQTAIFENKIWYLEWLITA